jgi:hypothetical protein
MDPKQIQIDIMEHGPVSAVIFFYTEFLSYNSGICSNCITFAFSAKIIRYLLVGIFKLKKNYHRAGDHVVKIIGCGEEKREPYWLVAGNMGNRFGKHNGLIKFPRVKDEFEIERHVVAGRKYSLLSPREYLVPSRSEETQLNISLLILNVLMAVVLM